MTNQGSSILKVKLSNLHQKCRILLCVKKLTETSGAFQKVYVIPDLSLNERQDNKHLCDKLFQRKNAGEKDLIIQRGKFVKKITTVKPSTLAWTPPKVWKIVTRMGNLYFLLLAAFSGPNPDFSLNSILIV